MSDQRRKGGSGGKRAYIAYSSRDRSAAQQVAQAFERVGIEVWWDTQVLSGDSWQSQIVQQIERADYIIVLWSSNTAESRSVLQEIGMADRLKKPLFPVMLDDTRPSGHYEYQLASRQWVELAQVDGLARSLATDSHLVEE